MAKAKEIQHKKKKGLTDKELIAKYGNNKPEWPFGSVINGMLSKPNPNAPAKIAKR